MIDTPLFGVGKQIASGSFIHLSSVINSAFLLKEIGYSGVGAGAARIVSLSPAAIYSSHLMARLQYLVIRTFRKFLVGPKLIY